MRARSDRPYILSNRSWIDGRQIGGRVIRADTFPDRSGRYRWRLIKALARRRYAAILIDCDPSWVVFVCAAKKALFLHCRILCVDLVLTRPNGVVGYLKYIVRRWLFTEVDRFVFYFRRTDEVQRVYRIPATRTRYLPFKANTLSALLEMQTADEGYFLACGRSNRDFRTLFEAVRQLPYDCRVLAPWDDLRGHGTVIDGVECPKNVSLVSDDGSVESWNRWIAGARAVVLPIEPGMLSPSGIGTYLVAMALGKCVIITEGPATWDMLTNDRAVLIPPRDVQSLRAALVRVAEDVAFRESIALKGREYALSLGGEDRLRSDVTQELAELLA
jgi:glycosyltransferase involved in cell wall biosynthesis